MTTDQPVLRFAEIGRDDVPYAGGKGASLGELARADVRVPDGFVVTTAAFRAAMGALEQDFTPITDWRASATYRLQIAGNLLLRLHVETTDPAQQTRLAGRRSLAHA